MSNTKHLADLVKVCSILPALVIMPAMAGNNIVTGDTSLSYQDVKISNTTTGTDDALGVDAQGKATIDFNGDITNIAVNAEGNSKYSAAVFNRNSKGTVLNFNTDKTILSATGLSDYVLGVRVNGKGSGVNFNGETEINMASNSTKQLRAIDVTDGGYVSLNDDTVLNLTGGKDTGEVIGILSSGAKSVDLAQGKDLEINASGAREVYGLYAQYGGAINMAQDTEVDIHSTATDGDAYGVVSGYYEKATGIIDSKGEIDIDVSGDNAYGLMNFGGASTNVADLDIVATAQQIARGIWVTDDNLFGGKAETTDVVIGSEGSKTEIIAKGADTKNTAGVWAEQLEKDVGLTILGDVGIKSDGYGVFAKGGAVANIGTEYAKEIKIVSESGRPLRAEYGAVLNVGNVNTESVDISTKDNYAIMSLYADTVVDIKGKNIDVSTSGNNYMAAYAGYAGTLNIGTEDTENINLSATDFSAVQVLQDESKMDITGKSIVISNNANTWGAVHSGNNSIKADNDYDKSATLDIKGENIFIKNSAEKGIGVTALSQGVVNIEGNTTIQAQKAIAARGEAKVNINKSGEHVVKMDGDMHFNYDKATSGSKVDAFVDVTLAGADSYWTGNTVVSYGSGKPADMSYFEVGSAKLTLKDGAIWNAKKIVDYGDEKSGVMYAALNDLVINGGTVNIQDTERGIFVDRIVANDATFNGGTLNVNETIDITSGTTVFNSNVSGENGVLTLANGATLDIGYSVVELAELNINGTLMASLRDVYDTVDITGVLSGTGTVLLNAGATGTYDVTVFKDFENVEFGKTYDVEFKDDKTKATLTTRDAQSIAADTGASIAAAGAVSGLAASTDATIQQVSLRAQAALNNGDIALVEKEMAKANPDTKPVSQSVAASVQNQVVTMAAGRMSAIGGGATGRAGGDVTGAGVWTQGMFNKSKFADKFHGYTRGFAIGGDTLIDNVLTIGGGYAFSNSDIHADGRNMDVENNSIFMYAQYKPAAWYVNATLNYTKSDYADASTVFGYLLNDEYETKSYGAQAMFGYDFANGVTPEFGMRYLHVSQEDHVDVMNREIAGMDADFLSGVAGLKYAFTIESDSAVKFSPTMRAAMTYDFLSDDATVTVVVPGASAYYVDVDRLSRLGGEFGIGLTAEYRGLEVSLNYELDLHQDYTSQTGLLKFRYDF